MRVAPAISASDPARRARSLRWRLTAVTLASMAVALLVLSIGIMVHEQAGNRAAAITDYGIQAAMIARNASAALELGDHAAGARILDALEASNSVVEAELRDLKGQVLVARRWKRGPGLAPADPLRIHEAIMVGGNQTGTVSITVDLGGLRDRIGEYVVAVFAAVVLASLLGYILLIPLVRRLLQPLDRLTVVARKVTETGDFGLRAPEESRDEIGELARGFNDMLALIQVRDAALAEELTERRKAESRLEQLAHFDPITRLPNRHYFNERVVQVVEDSRRLGARAAILLIDIDDFKLVNDTLGHNVGDRLLEEAGKRIKGELRANDTVARLGGDEFAVILERIRGRDEPRLIAEKIVASFAETLPAEGHAVHVGASMGIALYPDDAQSVSGMLRCADTAMYEAKARGKRGYRFFEPAMDMRVQRRLKVERELRQARDRGEFFVVYQPQVSLASGRHAGVEALVRWRHPERGVVAPGEFITVAEESGLIVDIGRFVLQSALDQARLWREEGAEVGQMAVNVSARQLESDDFVPSVLEALARNGVAPGMLEMEITETLLMGGSEAIGRIETLSEAGVRFAIDDFGTGYSSLGYLKRVPISTLKIDRQFIEDLAHDQEDLAITQAIIALGRSLGLTTVAEGVASTSDIERLRKMGCSKGQGYAISEPLPAAKITTFVRNWGRTAAQHAPRVRQTFH